MTESHCNQHRYDFNTSKIREKEMTVPQLITNLKDIRISDPKGLKPTLKAICEQNGLATKFNIEVIIEGWVQKPKGAIQVLFERGWLDLTLLHLYTGDGRKEDDPKVSQQHTDPTGCLFSIDCIMKLQKDFMNEVTLLQLHAQKLGVSINRSPKCHPELAGEGIEYLWALAKWYYRRSPILKKRSKTKFIKLVEESTSPDLVLRACIKKARSYMKLYKALEDVNLNDEMKNEKHDIIEKSIKVYSKMKQTSCTHQSMADKHLADVREIEQSIPLDSVRSNDAGIMDERIWGMNDGDQKTKAAVKKEIVTLLIKKMEQLA